MTYAELPAGSAGGAARALQSLIRANTYDPKSDTITLTVRTRHGDCARSPVTTKRCSATIRELLELRKAYAMKQGTVDTAEHRHALTAFIWWSAWSAVTERPGKNITYTNNWPHEPLVGNTPPATC